MEWYSYLESSIADANKMSLEATQFEDVVYLQSGSGYSLTVERDILKYITIYNGYEGILPYGISWSQSNSNIVSRLGEPDKKLSSKALGIEITYIQMGVSIEFLNYDWNDVENPVKSIILFKGIIGNPFSYEINCNLCSFCHAEGKYRCSS